MDHRLGSRRTDDFDPEVACRYAAALGPSVACRVGLMLDLVGYGDPAREYLGRWRRSDRVTPLAARGVEDRENAEIDSAWNVALNIPRERVPVPIMDPDAILAEKIVPAS